MKALIARPTKAIDQEAQGIAPGGYYVRLDDRSTFSQSIWDAQGSALAMSTVYACVRVLAEDVAKIPWVLYRKLPGGGKERAIDHPLYPVLHDQPNPDMTSFVWRELMMSHLATWGNAYAEKVYDSLGRLQLWPIRPDRMEAKYDRTGRKVYTYLSPTGQRTEMKPDSIFHIPGLSSNGLMGMSPIALHAKTLRLAETAQEFGTNFFQNRAMPAGVLSHPNTLSAPAVTRLATQMEELRGSRNAGKTVVLEEGLTFTEVGVPPQDAQYIETRKFQRNIIATEIFRMKPHKVGDLEHATFSNIEHESLDHVIDTMMPWYVRFEQETKAQLIEEPDVFAEFLVDGLLRGDAQARAAALQIRWQHGTLSADEWREMENENPLPDGIGKLYYVPGNYAAVNPPPGEQLVAPATVRETVPAPIQPGEAPQLVAVKSAEVRCDRGHLLAEMATPPYRFTCPKCKSVKSADALVVEDSTDAVSGLKAALRSLAEPPVINVPAPVVNVAPPIVNVPPLDLEPVADAIREMSGRIDEMNAPKTREVRRDGDGRIVGLTEWRASA